ncbi:MAG: lipoate-protein ligase [Dehalococcoidia bacterium]|nr:lipoate-protein ligase [Dehalococcoidia bacterium]
MAHNWLLVRLGLVDYLEAWGLQQRLLKARQEERIDDVLLLLQHPHVYTLGRRARPEHVLIPQDELARRGVALYSVDRGGDVTYHGPGQIVGYPILNLRHRGLDVHRYIRGLEEALIGTMSDLGIEVHRDLRHTGVWVGEEKIAAIGVRVSRGVTMHGFALNVNTDLSYFDHIVPCGIEDRGVTSVASILGHHVELDLAEGLVAENMAQVYGGKMVEVDLAEVELSLTAVALTS